MKIHNFYFQKINTVLERLFFYTVEKKVKVGHTLVMCSLNRKMFGRFSFH